MISVFEIVFLKSTLNFLTLSRRISFSAFLISLRTLSLTTLYFSHNLSLVGFRSLLSSHFFNICAVVHGSLFIYFLSNTFRAVSFIASVSKSVFPLCLSSQAEVPPPHTHIQFGFRKLLVLLNLSVFGCRTLRELLGISEFSSVSTSTVL